MDSTQQKSDIRSFSPTARHIFFGVLFAVLATFSAFGLTAFANFGPCSGLKDSHLSTRIGAFVVSSLFFIAGFFSMRSFWGVDKERRVLGVLVSLPFLGWMLLLSVYVGLIGMMGAFYGG